jgi:hypothetical protein
MQKKLTQRGTYLNCRGLHDTFILVLVPLKLFESTAGDDRLDLLPAFAVRERNENSFEKLLELRELGSFPQVEGTRVSCPQEA